ncbi:hypothetical protein ACILG0_17955 [Pseudomonadota bacterium AL_CKDN230030165-1A_HGKHYDSX7]
MVESAADVSRRTSGLVILEADASGVAFSQAWHYVNALYGVAAVAVLFAIAAIRYARARRVMGAGASASLGRLCATTALSTSLGACVVLTLHGVEPIIALESGAAGAESRERSGAVLAPFIATMLSIVLWARASLPQRGLLLIYGGVGVLGNLLAGWSPLWSILVAMVIGALSVPCAAWILNKAERVARP